MTSILAISSEVGVGGVGLSAIRPALRRKGYKIKAVPTVFFPYRPDIRPSEALVTPYNMLEQKMVRVINADPKPDAVLIGYFAEVAQVETVADILNTYASVINDHQIKIILDPVSGDDGKRYVPEDVTNMLMQKLVPIADFLTPNAFEAAAVLGADLSSLEAAASSVKGIAGFKENSEIIITSATEDDHRLSIWHVAAKGVLSALKHHKISHPPKGTGDIFAGYFSAFIADGQTSEAAICKASEAVLEILSTPFFQSTDGTAYIDDYFENPDE